MNIDLQISQDATEKERKKSVRRILFWHSRPSDDVLENKLRKRALCQLSAR